MNIHDFFNEIQEYCLPKIIGEVNDVNIKIAKVKGEGIPWHNHQEEDEMFFILEGSLLFEIEGQESFNMQQGDIFIVKRGLNHRVSAVEECRIMPIENKETKHTGEVVAEVTRTVEEELG